MLSKGERPPEGEMAEAPTIRHTDEQWLAALRGPERNKTLTHLREVLVRGLRVTLKKRPEGICEADIEDFAQEALVKILHNLDSYRGRAGLPPGRRRSPYTLPSPSFAVESGATCRCKSCSRAVTRPGQDGTQ